MSDQFTIEMVQGSLIGGVAGHNFLRLKNGQGQVIGELHGLATGLDNEPITIGWAPWHKLKFYADRRWTGSTTGQATLFTGTEAQAEAMWERAELAGRLMNDQNLSYSMFGFSIFSQTKNSNAVASTLIAAMGLNEPLLSNALTPGTGNLLLGSSDIVATQNLIPIPAVGQNGPHATTSPLTPISIFNASQYFLVSSNNQSLFTSAADSANALSQFTSAYGSSGLDIHASFGLTSFANGNVTFGSGSYFNLPAGAETSNGWFSWDVSSLNIAANSFVKSLLSSTGNASAGEQLSFGVAQQSSGDWRLSFSASSHSSYSPLVDRIKAAGQPHGMDDFLVWFNKRAEEMARDVVIVNSTIPAGDQDSLMINGTEPSAAYVKNQPQLNSGLITEPIENGHHSGDDWAAPMPPVATAFETSVLLHETETAAGVLVESMGQWASCRNAGLAVAEGCIRPRTLISDYAAAI